MLFRVCKHLFLGEFSTRFILDCRRQLTVLFEARKSVPRCYSPVRITWICTQNWIGSKIFAFHPISEWWCSITCLCQERSCLHFLINILLRLRHIHLRNWVLIRKLSTCPFRLILFVFTRLTYGAFKFRKAELIAPLVNSFICKSWNFAWSTPHKNNLGEWQIRVRHVFLMSKWGSTLGLTTSLKLLKYTILQL